MKTIIYNTIEPAADKQSKASKIYDIVMMISIIVSMVPLTVKSDNNTLVLIDYITVGMFIADYILRFVTSDLKLKKGNKSYFIYPFTPMAIIDLLSILPSVFPLAAGFKALRLFRFVRTLKVFRSLKIFRYSKNVERITKVLKNEIKPLLAVMSLALFYILFAAIVMFNIEPDTFENFFKALYWATISLTSVGYGDIYPTSTIGQLFTMLSSLVGVAVVALPSGILTAGYMKIINDEHNENK